jgi:hypothetical protein
MSEEYGIGANLVLVSPGELMKRIRALSGRHKINGLTVTRENTSLFSMILIY